MKALTTALLLLLLVTIPGMPQSYTLLATRGKVLVSSGPQAKQPVTAGKKLTGAFTLHIPAQGYACVLTGGGISVELVAAGVYEPADIEKLATAKKKSSGGKFADLVLTELSKGGANGEMRHTGAVEREVFEHIALTFPPDTYLLDDHFVITWHQVGNCLPYLFTLTDGDGKQLQQIEATDGYISIKKEEWRLRDGAVYHYQITCKGNGGIRSEEGTLLYPASAERATASALADTLLKELGETPLGLLSLAKFYEAGSYYVNALACYRAALEQAPNSGAFAVLYRDFLQRINLTELAEQVNTEPQE